MGTTWVNRSRYNTGEISEYSTSGTQMKETVNNSGYKVFAPMSLALWENILFVAENGGEVIDAYNISSQVYKRGFINTGLNSPMGLALLGDKLLITNSVSYGIDEYNAATGGTPIKVNFISGANGLGIPTAIAVSTDGKTVYVGHKREATKEYDNFGNGNVATYSVEPGGGGGGDPPQPQIHTTVGDSHCTRDVAR